MYNASPSNSGEENTAPRSALSFAHLPEILRQEFPGASRENLAGALSVAQAEGATTDQELLSLARKALVIATPVILP